MVMNPGALIQAGNPSLTAGTSTLFQQLLSYSPNRLYKCSNAGPNNKEQDYGSDQQNGTWSATGASQVRGLVPGDVSPAAFLDGVAGRLSLPTKNLPTLAQSWSVVQVFGVWAAVGTNILWDMGNEGTSAQFAKLLFGTTALQVTWLSATLSYNMAAGFPNPIGSPYLHVTTYNGTTVAFWEHYNQFLTGAAALSLAYGGANGGLAIGSDPNGTTNFAHAIVSYWALYTGVVLTQQQIVNIVNAYRGSGA